MEVVTPVQREYAHSWMDRLLLQGFPSEHHADTVFVSGENEYVRESLS